MSTKVYEKLDDTTLQIRWLSSRLQCPNALLKGTRRDFQGHSRRRFTLLLVAHGGLFQLLQGTVTPYERQLLNNYSTYRHHHICGMISNPLECLKIVSSAHTTVVALDSWTVKADLDTDSKGYWARLLIYIWDALEGEREALDLCIEKPTEVELIRQIRFRSPKVQCAAIMMRIPVRLTVLVRCGFKQTRMTAGFMSSVMFRSRYSIGMKLRNNW